MKSFDIKTRIYFGDQALDRLTEIPYEKVLIVTDPFIAQGKMIDLVTGPLQRGGKQFEIFKDVVPDPPIEKISEGVKKMLEYRPDVIVAVGGGSAIDSSKSIRELCGCRTDRDPYYQRDRIRGDILCGCNRSGGAGEISSCIKIHDAG